MEDNIIQLLNPVQEVMWKCSVSVSTDGFLLLEEVEAAFSTTEQSLKKFNWLSDNVLSATSSRMTRQKKEIHGESFMLLMFVSKTRALLRPSSLSCRPRW